MTTIDDFFVATDESPHPRLRDWKKRLATKNASASVEVFRSNGEFGQAKPEMHVQFKEGGRQTHLDTVPWDDDLNAGLILLKVRSVSPEQEAERFALGIRAAMRRIEREFGDGYFNAVLVELIKESHLDRYPEIAEVMRYAQRQRSPPRGRGLRQIHDLSRADRGCDQRPGEGPDPWSRVHSGGGERNSHFGPRSLFGRAVLGQQPA